MDIDGLARDVAEQLSSITERPWRSTTKPYFNDRVRQLEDGEGAAWAIVHDKAHLKNGGFINGSAVFDATTVPGAGDDFAQWRELMRFETLSFSTSAKVQPVTVAKRIVERLDQYERLRVVYARDLEAWRTDTGNIRRVAAAIEAACGSRLRTKGVLDVPNENDLRGPGVTLDFAAPSYNGEVSFKGRVPAQLAEHLARTTVAWLDEHIPGDRR